MENKRAKMSLKNWLKTTGNKIVRGFYKIKGAKNFESIFSFVQKSERKCLKIFANRNQ